MAKKQFDAQTATSKFFTNAQDTQSADSEQNTDSKHNTDNTDNKHEKYPGGFTLPRKQGRPKKAPGDKVKRLRYNLLLEADLNQFLHEIVWQKRMTMTDYVNALIRADYEAYLKDCKEKGKDPFEGWENPNEI